MSSAGDGRRSHATTVVAVGGRPVAVRIREVELEVVSGPDTGQKATLAQRQISVGTSPANDLVLSDPTTSRFHFRIRAAEDGYRLLDAGSTNGTSVNGVRVRDGYLEDNCRIAVGNTTMVAYFRTDEATIELSADERFGDAIGRSLAMSEVFAVARRAARTQSTVLLLGETGTGKDVLARAIHDNSPRARGPFVVFDCGAVSESLIESELFGHVRGAFTSADLDHAGVFERARGGTLLIDEIGELPPELQPKLLRAIDNRVITPVGGTEEVPVDVRIIAATNRDLWAMVARDEFRSDLFYRLAIVPIEVPPLRDRTEDIPLIAGHLLSEILADSPTELSALRPHFEEAFSDLKNYRWPGNVRELRNALERAVAMAEPSALAKDGISRLVELRSSLSRTLGTRPPLQVAREQFDRDYLRDILSATGGNLKRAADIADVHPKSLARLLRRYGISR